MNRRSGDTGEPRSIGSRWCTFALSIAFVLVLVTAALAVASPASAASGDLLWQRLLLANGPTIFNALAPAPKAGAYVVGTTSSANNNAFNDFVAARWDASGVRRWLRTFDGPGDGADYGEAAATDGRGDLFVGGYVTRLDTSFALAVVKYDSAGHRRWARVDSAPAASIGSPMSLAVDKAGDVYVAGTEPDQTATGAPEDGFALIKYSASGVHRWTRRYIDSPAGQPNGARALAIAVDAAGDVYLTGTSYQGLAHGYDVLTLKYDSAGHRRWARLWDGSGLNDAGSVLAVTSTGAAYVGGYTTSGTSGEDALLLKYGSAGALQWSRTYTGAGANPDAYNDIALLGNGDVTATGFSTSASTQSDVLLARYGPGGSPRWIRTWDGNSLFDLGVAVTPGPRGAIYVAGDATIFSGLDSLILKYSGTGGLRWNREQNSAGMANDGATALLVARGSVYVAGYQGFASTVAALLRYAP